MNGSPVRCEKLHPNSDRCQHRYIDDAEDGNLTCGDTEKRKEGDTNPLRGDIIVLELLAIVGAVRGTLRAFEVSKLSQGSPGRRREYALMTPTGNRVWGTWSALPSNWTCF